MCGIAGIIDFNGRPVLQEELEKMTDAIAHRGPDGEGFFIDGVVGFGHRRLAIIDLSETAAQPMTRFGLTITYNGEIYNYIELRSELQKQGIVFTTQSDTEVILAAYHIWGRDCVQRFNGMWAMAIYDAANDEVFLSRDRFGEKPLYYTERNGQFLFCSSVSALLEPHQSPVANAQVLMNYLVQEKAEPLHHTFFSKYCKLDGGQSLIVQVQTGAVQLIQYYEFGSNQQSELCMEEAVSKLQALLHHSVELRLRSDVAVGSTLSGGLDSSYITSIASAFVKSKQAPDFTAFSAGTSEAQTNELPYARLLANHCGIQLNSIIPGINEYKAAIPAVVAAQEEPIQSLSVVMQYTVMQLAHRAGFKVLIDGQGADELFLGYPIHLGIVMRQQSLLRAFKIATQSAGRFSLPAALLAKIGWYHAYPLRKAARQMDRWSSVFSEAALQQVTNHNMQQMENAINQSVQAFQQFDIVSGNLPALLRHEDRNSMAFSIETRLPYLDYRLVEWAVQLPHQQKLHNGWSKYILRKAMQANVPAAIAWRKGKIGFEPPAIDDDITRQWLNPEILRKRGLKLLSGASLQHLSVAMRWRLLSVQLWAEAFDVTFE
ncbi:MAG: asparagine synthase (glutamine-hydrolyzing) [Chitinophagaceae bacterium]|nr:asparagine synthase (glutamine-hydrolyzing) [Chitinophagaceae bacterium]